MAWSDRPMYSKDTDLPIYRKSDDLLIWGDPDNCDCCRNPCAECCAAEDQPDAEVTASGDCGEDATGTYTYQDCEVLTANRKKFTWTKGDWSLWAWCCTAYPERNREADWCAYLDSGGTCPHGFGNAHGVDGVRCGCIHPFGGFSRGSMAITCVAGTPPQLSGGGELEALAYTNGDWTGWTADFTIG